MAIAWVAGASNTYVGTSGSVTSSGSWSSGSTYLIAFHTIDNSGNITTPSGWTVKDSHFGGNLGTAVFERIHDGSSSYSFSSDFASARILIGGWSGASAMEAINWQDGGFSTTVPGSVTVITANSTLIFLGSILGSQTFTAPGGMTERMDTNSSTIADESSVTTGAKTRNATASGAQFNHGYLISLPEAGGAATSFLIPRQLRTSYGILARQKWHLESTRSILRQRPSQWRPTLSSLPQLMTSLLRSSASESGRPQTSEMRPKRSSVYPGFGETRRQAPAATPQ